MKDAVIQSLLWSFQATSWGKSVWTYSYVVRLLAFYGVGEPNIARRVYQELGEHFTKVDAVTGKRVLSGDYDGVFNATCTMLEVLNIFTQMYDKPFAVDLPYELKEVIDSAENWMIQKVKSGAVFDQDICYCVLYLIRFGKFRALDRTVKTTLVSLFERLLEKIAEEVLSGSINGRSSIDLSRVYRTLCGLSLEKAVAQDKAVSYLDQIESTLRTRQDIHGNWKHISETSEITLMLLEAHSSRCNINHELTTVNTLIANGIVALHSQYSVNANMWADDIGVTAKAMHAIGLYDRVFNFSINDFFSDLKIHHESTVRMSEDLTKERIGYFYRVIDGLERNKEVSSRHLIESESGASSIRRRLSRTRYALASSLAMLVATISISGLFIGILYLDHKDILVKELGDWRTVLESAVAGVIAAVVLSETFRWFSKRFKE
jgi:hypothetical protein